MDPAGTAESFPSPPGLGEAPALFQQDAESFSNQGGAPALHRMYSESSASNSAFFSEGHVSLRHKLSEVATKLSVMVVCLQECVSTLVELQSDSFNQQDAHLERRESSLGSLTSRNLGNSNNSNNKQEEERSSLGELTPRTCRSKSEEELEPDKLEQEEAKQQEQREAAEAKQLTAQQTGPEQQQQQQQQQQKPQEEKQKKLPKHKKWCNICWKKGHTTEACWYNYQQHSQQHQQAWITPSQMQQQTAAASVATPELRQQHAYPQPQQDTKNSLGQHKNIGEDSWATILVDTGAAISVAPRSFAPGIPLQALERPVELRTATGVRIPIFGKKTMQLLASPLCLEVSFVIAEVTTPILGVDTLLRENLSLRFEGCQQQLVHASGVCTQLTQEGKLLYLRALPAQVGSPIFMIGSLLQDSILPENKLEPTALGVRATLSKEEVLDKGGASDHSFSQENLDKEHNLGKNKTALGPAPLQPLGAQTAYTAKKNKPSAKESSHQQLGLKRKKQSGHPAASKLRNWQQTRSIKEIELALMAAEERNSLDPDTRSDLSFRFLLTFSLVNQWQLTKAEVGTAYPARPESTISMEDLGLRAFAADSNIFLGEQLAIMRFQGELLIGGAQLEQECFLTKLSATGLLLKTTQLDHNTPVSFRNMTLEYDQLEHSLCVYMPCAFYMHLVKRHSLQHEPPANLPQEELAPEASRQHSQVLDAKQRKLYQKTVGQLVWLKACRPDTSFVIEQLNQSFDNPTAHAHAQLLCLLRYLSGTMHYSLILQPCSKKILEKASNTELLAYSSTSWTAESPISTACLSCFGVTMATSCRQARGAWTQQAAEVEAVVLAKQLASHCQSLIQGMQLDLALPELKIFFCSLTCDLVTGRPLALKLGLSRRNRQVQLQDGQLRLCKVLPHKNLAECLTKNLSTASFHRLLPKLMVHTRAVKAQALLTMLGGENQASFCSSSFFIGMVALNPPMAQTRASTTNSLQLLSLSEGTEENAKALAFPELSLNQLQKWIASRQLTQPSIDSLTGYSLSIDSLTEHRQLDRILEHRQLDRIQLEHRQLDRIQLEHRQLDRIQLEHRQLDRIQLEHRQLDRIQLEHRQLDRIQLEHRQLDQIQLEQRSVPKELTALDRR